MSAKNYDSLPLCACRRKEELYRITNFPDDMTDDDMEAGLPYGYRTTWTCLRDEHYFDAVEWVTEGVETRPFYGYSPTHAPYTGEN